MYNLISLLFTFMFYFFGKMLEGLASLFIDFLFCSVRFVFIFILSFSETFHMSPLNFCYISIVVSNCIIFINLFCVCCFSYHGKFQVKLFLKQTNFYFHDKTLSRIAETLTSMDNLFLGPIVTVTRHTNINTQNTIHTYK